MSRLESPVQVALLLLGAAAVSFLLIMFLDVEVRSRKMHKETQPEIQNGNLFSAAARAIVRGVRRLLAPSHAASTAPARTGARRLQWSSEAAGHRVRHERTKDGRRSQAPASAAPPPAGACYSPNQVLVVVGATCAVNLAFMLAVLALLHLCSRPNRVAARLDSLVLVEEEEVRPLKSESYCSVQEYVDSLPEYPGSMVSLHTLGRPRAFSMENLLFAD